MRIGFVSIRIQHKQHNNTNSSLVQWLRQGIENVSVSCFCILTSHPSVGGKTVQVSLRHRREREKCHMLLLRAGHAVEKTGLAPFVRRARVRVLNDIRVLAFGAVPVRPIIDHVRGRSQEKRNKKKNKKTTNDYSLPRERYSQQFPGRFSRAAAGRCCVAQVSGKVSTCLHCYAVTSRKKIRMKNRLGKRSDTVLWLFCDRGGYRETSAYGFVRGQRCAGRPEPSPGANGLTARPERVIPPTGASPPTPPVRL